MTIDNARIGIMYYILLSIFCLCVGVYTKIIPTYYIVVFLVTAVICFFGWEMWLSGGLLGGESVTARGGGLSPFLNALVMSLGDGIITVTIMWICIKIFGKEMFMKWYLPGFLAFWALANIQNAVATEYLAKTVDGQNLSLAPLIPFKASYQYQLQDAWIIVPIIIYVVILKLSW